jgi:hypothetical protein
VSFSDLVHKVEADVSRVLLPSGAPSDTREAEALAKKAEGIAVSVDPELAPYFDRIGVLGDYVERALTELGQVVGSVKEIIATRAQQVPPPTTPAAVPSEPSSPSDTAPADSAAGSTAATPSSPVDPTSAPSAGSDGASMSDVTPPAAASPAPVATPPAEPATPATPASTEPPTSEGADPGPQPAVETEPADPTAPAGTDASTPSSSSETAPPEPADTALAQAEADFAGLSPEDKAAFETAEGLETGSTPPPPT